MHTHVIPNGIPSAPFPVQFFVARGAVTPSPQVPTPSNTPMSCGPTPGSWTLPPALPTSWCTWPGVSCISPYATSCCPAPLYNGNSTPVNNYGCASGIYIYSVGGIELGRTHVVGRRYEIATAFNNHRRRPHLLWGQRVSSMGPMCRAHSRRILRG